MPPKFPGAEHLFDIDTLAGAAPGPARHRTGPQRRDADPDQVSALVEETLDIGFLRPPVREPELDVRVLCREPLIAALPASHPLIERSTVRLAW